MTMNLLIEDVMQDGRYWSSADLAKEVGSRERVVKADLKCLVESGDVVRIETNRGPRYRHVEIGSVSGD